MERTRQSGFRNKTYPAAQDRPSGRQAPVGTPDGPNPGGMVVGMATRKVTVTLDVANGWHIDTTAGGLNGRGQTVTGTLELDRNVQLLTEMTRK